MPFPIHTVKAFDQIQHNSWANSQQTRIRRELPQFDKECMKILNLTFS